jgi:hypothetical protein
MGRLKRSLVAPQGLIAVSAVDRVVAGRHITPRRPVTGISRRCRSEEGSGCKGGDDELAHFHVSVLVFQESRDR